MHRLSSYSDFNASNMQRNSQMAAILKLSANSTIYMIPLMDNCIIITPGILHSNYINSEHRYTYMDLYVRDCTVCLYCTGYTVLSWCNFSSMGVLNLMYL